MAQGTPQHRGRDASTSRQRGHRLTDVTTEFLESRGEVMMQIDYPAERSRLIPKRGRQRPPPGCPACPLMLSLKERDEGSEGRARPQSLGVAIAVCVIGL